VTTEPVKKKKSHVRIETTVEIKGVLREQKIAIAQEDVEALQPVPKIRRLED